MRRSSFVLGGLALLSSLVGGDALAGAASQVPTTAEWDTAKEVPVKGSTAAGCETKRVREWVRISCKKPNSTGGKPKSVTVTKGGGNETFTFATDGVVASLVFRFIEQADVVATFKWSDGSKTFKSAWPKGAPEPQSKGEFS